MNREEKIKLAIEKGYTYNPETGIVYTPKNKKVSAKHTQGYIVMCIWNGTRIQLLAHQFAWYCVYGEIVEQIDHINMDKTDNRIVNLRKVTDQENKTNNNKKGYYYNELNKNWRSRITNKGKTIEIGSFKTEEEARAAYIQAKQNIHKLWG
jgi:hypothetical protein